MKSIYIAVTAHNPLSRVAQILEVLKGYTTLPLKVDVDFYIDSNHRHDLDEFSLIVASHIKLNRIGFSVAPSFYTGFSLCWAHKPYFVKQVEEKNYDFYMYSEDDMKFTEQNFSYWLKYKNFLKQFNYEPGFCRFEKCKGRKIPFDNYRKWSLNGETKSVWGDVPYKCDFLLTPNDSEFIGFTTLGNPYNGMMILDQEQADEYIKSESMHPEKSHALTGKRNWPIADRSSMGTAFENLLPWQEHRRVVPLVRSGDSLTLAECGLLEHLDKKYSVALAKEQPIIDTDTMFTY